MDTIFKKPAPKTGGFYESAYKLFMRRNSVYVTVIIIGAFAGERAVDYGVKTLWENNNKGEELRLEVSVLT
ncbi:hypothetical protein MKW98_000386 [Papaver atlanticum]|uniref:Complex III subunit 9 n=1 Tax=Papaver atlanticum TaxID=357466 RepID=A0AAD4S491_9MAGN|nr:hypothetical protein MKW98_000386 [Papaver atlanticum]